MINSALAAQLDPVLEMARDFDHLMDRRIGVGILFLESDGHIRRVNKDWTETFGLDFLDIEGRHITEFIHPDDLHDSIQALRDSKDGWARATHGEMTNRYRSSDGNYIVCRWIGGHHLDSTRLGICIFEE